MKQNQYVLAFILIFLIISCGQVKNFSDLKFYGADSKRAQMKFDNYVDFKIPSSNQQDKLDDVVSKYNSLIDELIEIQLSHMFGTFTVHTKPFNFYKTPGIPRNDPKIRKYDYKKISNTTLRIFYSYEDIAVFKKTLFKDSQEKTFSFYLPREPGAYGLNAFQKGCTYPQDVPDACYFTDLYEYEANQTTAQKEAFYLCNKLTTCSRGKNRCTDTHYNTAEDFWYFWDPNPEEGNCPMKTSDLVTVKASLKSIPSTKTTYPDYKRLLAKNKTIRITYLIGIDEDFEGSDLGRRTFQNSYTLLTKGKKLLDHSSDANALFLTKYEKKLLKEEPDVVFTQAPGPHSNEPLHKTIQWQGDNYKVLLNMYLVDPDDAHIQQPLAVKGLRESDIFIYNGHSGLGSYFDVATLFARRRYLLPKDTYQIFFFNGCSTFSYYNADYFEIKGTKNLDILTNAIGAPFLEGAGNDVWLIRELINGEKLSWQKILDNLYYLDPEGSALTHVNGDE